MFWSSVVPPDVQEEYQQAQQEQQQNEGFETINGQRFRVETDAPNSSAWQWHPSAQAYAQTLRPHPTQPGKWIATPEAFTAAMQGAYQGSAGGTLDKIASAGPLIGAAALGAYALGPGIGGTEAFNAGTASGTASGAASGIGLPESYWSSVAEAGGTASDAAAANAGTIGTENFLGATAADTAMEIAPGVTVAESATLSPSAVNSLASAGGIAMPGATGALQTVQAAQTGKGVIDTIKEKVGNMDLKDALTVAGAATGLAGLAKAAGGSSTTQTSTTSVPPMSAEERELIALNTELARKQLSSIEQLQPFQQNLLEMSIAEMQRQAKANTAMESALPPDLLAQQARAEFDRAAKLGPMQEEIMQRQLETLRLNGAASPEQLAQIKAAADAAISSGTADIDVNTKRGIGLIEDELANSRGLRMTDTPILREATLLTRSADDQKANLVRSLRAAEATARLNHPLAVQQLQSNIALNTNSAAEAAKQFQAELRARAQQNRLALTGQASSSGIGLASIGGGGNALDALTRSRFAGAPTTTTASRGIGLSDVGQLASGIGGLMTGIGRL
jgi:hypothetical protein